MSKKSDIVKKFDYCVGEKFYSKYEPKKGIKDYKNSNTAIWLVENESEKKQYVVKMLKKRCTKEDIKERFYHEIESMEYLQNCNNISLPIIDKQLDIEEPWYIMPLALDLKKFFQLEDYDFNSGVEIALKLSKKLSEMHKAGYVHRDIKPENIFVYNKGYYFGDFELVSTRKYSEENITMIRGGKVGNRYYKSPELVEERISPENIDYKACDVFALSKMVFVILDHSKKNTKNKTKNKTNFLPFEGVYREDYGFNIEKQVNNTYELLNELFLESMHVLPDKRPTAETFCEKLNNYSEIDKDTEKSKLYNLKSKTRKLFKPFFEGDFNVFKSAEYRNYLEYFLNLKNVKIKSMKVPEMEVLSIEQSEFNNSIKIKCHYNDEKYSLIFFPSSLKVLCATPLKISLKVNVYNPGIAQKGYCYLNKDCFKKITIFSKAIQEALILEEEENVNLFIADNDSQGFSGASDDNSIGIFEFKFPK
jgi:serine/threonine protein kinase